MTEAEMAHTELAKKTRHPKKKKKKKKKKFLSFLKGVDKSQILITHPGFL